MNDFLSIILTRTIGIEHNSMFNEQEIKVLDKISTTHNIAIASGSIGGI